MKRALVLLALVLTAHAAAGSILRERDVLLTTDGVLYTVDAVHDPDVTGDRSPYSLSMTVQEGDARVTTPVPGAMFGGSHGHPSLAHDADSDTLFLFWQETLYRGVASRLLFASYQRGEWSEVTELDSVTWRFRRNLRIAVTRTIEARTQAGVLQLPQVVVHAVWWEQDGFNEFARYAMLGIDQGSVTSSDFRYLIEFTGVAVDKSNSSLLDADAEVLRHPEIFAAPGRDAVDVVFGDASTKSLHRLRIKPALDGRVRIPIGVRGPVMRNASFSVAEDARVSAVIDDDRLALYTVTEKMLRYVVYRNGGWSQERSVTLSDEVTAQTAIEALRRMVAIH